MGKEKEVSIYTRPALCIVDWRTAAQGQKEYTVQWIYSRDVRVYPDPRVWVGYGYELHGYGYTRFYP